MKVIQLIELLKTFPMDANVAIEWDGGWSNPDTAELQTDDKESPVVVFDCNEYGTYRHDR